MQPKIKEIWNNYTESLKTVDFSGHPIIKSAYGDKNSFYGWDIEHIYPKSLNGENSSDNLQPVSISTNNQKRNNFAGKIVHEYRDLIVTTEYNVIKDRNFIKTGTIFIKSQKVNNSQKISNIFLWDEMGIFFDTKGNKRTSFLDINESLTKKYLCFIDGNNPSKWQIKK